MNRLSHLDIEEIKYYADKNEAEKKDLIIKENYEKYQKVQSLYKKAFDAYLEQKVDINKEVDQAINASKLHFGVIDESEKNIYHNFSNLNSEYLFVRNFFFIERLERKHLEILEKRINSEDYKIDSELLKIVEMTYKDINKMHSNSNNKTFKVLYGTIPAFEFDNDELVFFLNYGDDTEELDGDDFFELKHEQNVFLNMLIEKLKDKFQETLKCKIGILQRQGIVLVRLDIREKQGK